MKKFIIRVAAVVTVGTLVLVGCPEESGGVTNFSYVCKNGTAAAGTGTEAGQSNCESCNDGYTLSGIAGQVGSTCGNFPFICENGIVNPGTSITVGVSNCDSCNQGYAIAGTPGAPGSTCGNFPFVCANGMKADGITGTEGESNCDSCDMGYTIAGTAGMVGSLCLNNFPSVCAIPGSENSSISVVYSDATGTYAACNPLQAATSPFGAASASNTATFNEINGGANSTSTARSLNVVAASDDDDTRGFITLNEDFDVSRSTLRFNIKSPETGGVNGIRVSLGAHRPAGSPTPISTYQTSSANGHVSFVNDDTWQSVVINIDEEFDFSSSNITAATVRSVGFSVLVDTNGAASGFGTQRFDIDEVRFEALTPNCIAPTSGGDASVGLIWGDVTYNSCTAISPGIYGAVHVPSRNAASRPPSVLTITSNTDTSLGGGASNSPLFTNLTIDAGSSAWAYMIADFSANYDATGKTLRFSIKSPSTDGTNAIGVFFEGAAGGPGDRTDTINQTFTNDGTWKAVLVPISSFTFPASGVTLSTIRRVVFSLVDTNGLSTDGVGAQTLDIDEIRFE